MSKKLSQQVIDYIFEHCNDEVQFPIEMLNTIEACFDDKKDKVKVYKTEKIDLKLFIKGYAKRCLQKNQNIVNNAKKAFIHDLCKDETLIEYLLHQSFFYQFSDNYFEFCKNFPGPWHDPDADKAGYSEIARIALSVMIFCINVAKMGWPITITGNAILIAGTTIDCSKLSDNPRLNSLFEAFLKEMIPLAIYVGTSQAMKDEFTDTSDASSWSVAVYALCEYMVTRFMLQKCTYFYEKIFGMMNPLSQYANGQFVFGLSSLVFESLFPKANWLSFPQLKKCLKPEYIGIIGQYFNLAQLNIMPVNTSLLVQQFRDYAREAYQFGNPINATTTSIVNDFYVCMRSKGRLS